MPFRAFVPRTRRQADEAAHEAFFSATLADVREPTAPFGRRDTHGNGSGIAEAGVEVNAALGARMRAAARRLGVSAASVCHVAWALVLARASGRGDVVFGTLLLGRMEGGAGADRAMGPFVNTLPVPIRVDGTGAQAGVRHAHALLTELLRHGHASLALAQRCSAVPAPAPLFSSLLNFRHSAGAEHVVRTELGRRAWRGHRPRARGRAHQLSRRSLRRRPGRRLPPDGAAPCIGGPGAGVRHDAHGAGEAGGHAGLGARRAARRARRAFRGRTPAGAGNVEPGGCGCAARPARPPAGGGAGRARPMRRRWSRAAARSRTGR